MCDFSHKNQVVKIETCALGTYRGVQIHIRYTLITCQAYMYLKYSEQYLARVAAFVYFDLKQTPFRVTNK